MPLYDEYQPYHGPLMKHEEAQLREAEEARGDGPIKKGVYLRGNRVVMEDPVLNAHVNIAYDRTA